MGQKREREREREERRVGLDGTPKEEEGGKGRREGEGHPLSFLSSALQRRREGEKFTILQIIISFEHRTYLTFCCGTVQIFLDAGESLLFPPSFSPLPPCPRAGPFLFSRSVWAGGAAVPFPSIPLLLSLLGSVGTGIAGGKREEAAASKKGKTVANGPGGEGTAAAVAPLCKHLK